MNTIRAAVLVAFAVSGVTCNDLRVGSEHGRIVFNETIQASPAIWRQSQQITVNVSDQEIISRVVVTDQRPDKDGEVKIIDGGEGQHKVVIEMKSPTVFRGFDFHVVVYAAQFQHSHDGLHPAVMTKDIDVNALANQAKDSVTAVLSNVTDKMGHDGPTPPTIISDLLRKSRNTEQPDPVVKFVSNKSVDHEDHTEVASTTEILKTGVTTEDALKVTGPIVPNIFPKLNFTSDDHKAHAKGKIVPTTTSTTEVPHAASSITTVKTHDNMTHENLDSISKELGQKAVFEMKH